MIHSHMMAARKAAHSYNTNWAFLRYLERVAPAERSPPAVNLGIGARKNRPTDIICACESLAWTYNCNTTSCQSRTRPVPVQIHSSLSLDHELARPRTDPRPQHDGGTHWYAPPYTIVLLLTPSPVLDGGTGFLKVGYAGQVCCAIILQEAIETDLIRTSPKSSTPRSWVDRSCERKSRLGIYG